jgi:hypothetical protein
MASLSSYWSSQMFTPRSVLFWDVTQRRLVVSYQLVSEPPIKPIFNGQLDCRPLKMGQTGCPTTSVANYLCTTRNNLEEWRSHLHHGWSLITMFTHILFLVPVTDRLKVQYGLFFLIHELFSWVGSIQYCNHVSHSYAEPHTSHPDSFF